MDIFSDRLERGRRPKGLTSVNDHTNEAIDMSVDHDISGE
jgi:hypothetical protein